MARSYKFSCSSLTTNWQRTPRNFDSCQCTREWLGADCMWIRTEIPGVGLDFGVFETQKTLCMKANPVRIKLCSHDPPINAYLPLPCRLKEQFELILLVSKLSNLSVNPTRRSLFSLHIRKAKVNSGCATTMSSSMETTACEFSIYLFSNHLDNILSHDFQLRVFPECK